MTHIWLDILTVLIAFLIAIVSPGPNFVLVVNTALTRTRKEGVVTALGVASGSALFAVAGLQGLILVISSVPTFALFLRFLGGSYLLYLAISMILNSVKGSSTTNTAAEQREPVQGYRAFSRGLLTNMTNPKAWAFYFSIFTLVVSPNFPGWAKILLCCSMFLMAFLWYGTVAMIISMPRVRQCFDLIQRWLNIGLGVALGSVGVRILFGR